MADLNIPPNAVLLVVDVQQAFDDPALGPRNNPEAEENIASLLAVWRWSERPVVHVQRRSDRPDSPFQPDQPGFAIKEMVRPAYHERVVVTSGTSAFFETDLASQLQALGSGAVVIVGLTTDRCIAATAQTAANLGYAVYVVHDATGTFDRVLPNGRRFAAEQVHNVALASLSGEYATIVDAETLFTHVAAAMGRKRAGVVVLRDDAVLLMYRRKDGREYYVIPGGGVREGESFAEAAVREAKEETSLDVVLSRKLWASPDRAHYFLVTEFSGELALGGPEAQAQSDDDFYQLQWVPLDRLPEVKLVPRLVKQIILAELAGAPDRGYG